MTHTPLRAGILGVGTIAIASYGFLPGLMEMKEDVTIVSVADPAIERACPVAAQYGIPEVYATLEEMLELSKIDLVINLTPIPLHGSTTLKILQAGTINLYNPLLDDPAAPPLEIFRLEAVAGVDGWINPRANSNIIGAQDTLRYKRAIMVKHLVECVIENKPPVLSAEHARHALEIMLQTSESARSGRVVDLMTTF